MTRKIETRCPILEFNFFWKKTLPLKFCTLYYWFWFDAVNGVLSQSFAYNYCSGLSNTQFTCWMLNSFDHIYKQETFFLLLLVTKIRNNIKKIKSLQNNQYYQKM